MRYAFICTLCDEVTEFDMSIGEYHRHPPALFHCGWPQLRYFQPTGQSVVNPLAGDKQYEGMRASDGTDISTRTKHRDYMRQHNLTTVDDYKDTWAQAQKARDEYRTTGKGGAVSRDDVARALHMELNKHLSR